MCVLYEHSCANRYPLWTVANTVYNNIGSPGSSLPAELKVCFLCPKYIEEEIFIIHAGVLCYCRSSGYVVYNNLPPNKFSFACSCLVSTGLDDNANVFLPH